MKMRPILFTGEMVQAIRAGRKTQTRRVVKAANPFELSTPCPYGAPGDLLWVKETWCPGAGFTIYRADCVEGRPSANTDDWNAPRDDRWRPSIHMPKAECRVVLQIKQVRVHQLMSISDHDALAEGSPCDKFHAQWYRGLWLSIHGKKYSWTTNPLVWAITFEVAADSRTDAQALLQAGTKGVA